MEGTISDGEGRTMPAVMQRDGAKLRIEFSTPAGQSAIINNGDQAILLVTTGGRTMALTGDSGMDGPEDPTADWQGDLANSATRGGPCAIAGESGAEWTRTEDGEANTACITEDGVMLRAARGGAVVWEASRVERGAQPASAFELPPGVQIMDLNNVGSMIDAYRQNRGQ